MDITVIASGLAFPEGPVIDRTGNLLVVEIAGSRISQVGMDGTVTTWADVTGSGTLGAARPNGHIGRRSVPDGFCFDSAGRVIVAGHQTRQLFVLDASDGGPLSTVDLPDAGATNCCFGGPEFTTLFVTSSDIGEVLAIEWPVPGMRLHADR